LIDRADAWHERAKAGWERHAEAVTVPASVVVEVCWLLGARAGSQAEQAFLGGIARGEWPVVALEAEDYARAAELTGIYADLPLGFVDASIVALAERLGADVVLTTDRRDFSVVRPRHVERFRLEP